MNILLLGKNGQLGWELRRTLAPLGRVVCLDYPEVDFARLESLRSLVQETRPNVVINAVAYTAVDKAEEEPDANRQVNGIAPGVLAEAARSVRAVMVHFSTDYVFDGTKSEPYTEEDAPNPLSEYARAKLLGEQTVQDAGGAYLVLRTSWMYSLRRDNFLKKVLQWARRYPTLRMVTDQVGSPTSARSLAEMTALALARDCEDVYGWIEQNAGVYHTGGDGAASRMELAQEILRLDPKREEQVVREILPALTADFPTPAHRPLNSVLDCSRFERAFGLRLPPWKEALAMTLDLDELCLH